jgi:hypothetical protein
MHYQGLQCQFAVQDKSNPKRFGYSFRRPLAQAAGTIIAAGG